MSIKNSQNLIKKVTYIWRNNFKIASFLHFWILKSAVSNQNLSFSVLNPFELNHVILYIVISGKSQIHFLLSLNSKDFSTLFMMSLKHLQRLLVLLSQKTCIFPNKWVILPSKELSVVSPTSQVQLFGVYLIWNINKNHIKVVV